MSNLGGITLNYKEYARLVGGDPTPCTVVIEQQVTIRRPPPPARLVCVHASDELLGRLFELRQVPTVIGRERGADFCVSDPSVSRAHARLDPRPDGVYEVTDLNSSNGTFVNREQVRSRVLRSGDRVHFGNTVFLYLTGDAI
jgi:hypothetical protein